MTSATPLLSVLVPVYNEERFLEPSLQRVLAAPLEKEVIVVDDGSTDGTKAILSRLSHELPIRVITHERNLGKGRAVRSAIAAGRGEILLIQDADLEYDPNDYPALVEPILQGRADAVIGSRFLMQRPRFFHPTGDPFFAHYIGNQVIIRLTNLLYGFDGTDYEGCYKAFTREVVQGLPLTADGFEFDNELVCKLLRRGQAVVEVPIHYHPRTYREGKKIQWQDGLRMVWTIVKWRVLPF